MPISSAPTFKGGFANIPLGSAGQILTSNGAGASPTFQASSGGGGGIGGSISFSPAAGTIDPTITGFVATAGPTGTGRIKITLAGNTSFEGLPVGADGQQLFLIIVAGNFLLTLLHLNVSTVQAEIFASNDFGYALHDCAQLFYDAGLGNWVLVP